MTQQDTFKIRVVVVNKNNDSVVVDIEAKRGETIQELVVLAFGECPKTLTEDSNPSEYRHLIYDHAGEREEKKFEETENIMMNENISLILMKDKRVEEEPGVIPIGNSGTFCNQEDMVCVDGYLFFTDDDEDDDEWPDDENCVD